MTRAEKFREMYNRFELEVLLTFPEVCSIGFADIISHNGYVYDCDGLACPEEIDGDCSKCNLVDYWSKEYKEPYTDNLVRIINDGIEIVLNGNANLKIKQPAEDLEGGYTGMVVDFRTGEIRGIKEDEG